jgi:uncharacterized protein
VEEDAIMKLTRHEFLKLVTGGSTVLAASGRSWFTSLAAAGRITNAVPAVPDVARPLPLTAVRLTGGPLKHAQELDAAYLLSLDPDRMLAFYRVRAGLEPKAPGYTGWDADGRQLTGHIAGHHLSAVSLMWAATGDARFKERADYIVAELKSVQDKNGDGFAGALLNVGKVFDEVSKGNIRAANFDLNGLWSPWYTLHKTFAGLRDAYRHTGNETALAIEVKFAQWAERFLAPMDDATIQRMLATEFGGMNEMMADLYADTGDKRWLDLSYKIEHKAVFDPLRRGDDPLDGLHGNTQVPKMVGLASRYQYAGDRKDLDAAAFFWDRVVNHHTFATGGHGKDEYFREPDKLANITEGRTAETCNVYNMLKLTRKLFALQPDVRYAEFHEQALFNHILGSMDPEDGATCYMVPVGAGVRREYADMQRSFTCCVGTGMENHALHGLGLYYESGDRLWVNVYAPSTARWDAAGIGLDMQTSFPDGDTATLTLDARAPRTFTLAMRRPSWAGDGFSVSVNGRRVTASSTPGSYVELRREWKSGDTVTLTLPRTVRLKALSDNPHRAAVLLGPLVLAGDLGAAPRRRTDGDGDGTTAAPPEPPVLVTDRPVNEWLKPVANRPGVYRAIGVARRPSNDTPFDVDFMPFHQIHRRSYAAYWDVLTAPEYKDRLAEIEREHARVRAIEVATVAHVPAGEPEKEKAFNQQGEDSTIVRADGRPGRRSAKWFSYDLPIDPSKPMALVVTYNSDNRRARSFEILANGTRVGVQTLPQTSAAKFIDIQYPLPAGVAANNAAVTVRFQATNGSEIAPVFSVRTIRAEAP